MQRLVELATEDFDKFVYVYLYAKLIHSDRFNAEYASVLPHVCISISTDMIVSTPDKNVERRNTPVNFQNATLNLLRYGTDRTRANLVHDDAKFLEVEDLIKQLLR